MMRIFILTFCSIFIFKSGYTQSTNLSGAYGHCSNEFSCFQIVLHKDGRFIYYIDEWVGKGVVDGTWHQIFDTLMLNINFPDKLKTLVKEQYDTNLSNRKLTFISYGYNDTSLMTNVEIKINDTEWFYTDSIGVLNLPKDFLVKKVEVNSLYIQDSVLLTTNNQSNNTYIYFLIDFTPAIYQQPDKWLIEGKSLIPYWLEGGEYKLSRDRIIKKVSKRKILPELK